MTTKDIEAVEALVHPRKFGLQTYTDEQLRKTAEALIGLPLKFRDERVGTIKATEIVPEGIKALAAIDGGPDQTLIEVVEGRHQTLSMGCKVEGPPKCSICGDAAKE